MTHTPNKIVTYGSLGLAILALAYVTAMIATLGHLGVALIPLMFIFILCYVLAATLSNKY